MIRLVQRRLIIPRGDTGAFSIPALPSLQEGNNIAVFTIFSAATRKKIFEKRIASIENNSITVEFEHKDTVNLPVGRYLWDIKIYNTPEFKNGGIEDGDLTDGKVIDSYYSAFKLPECVITPTGDALLTADDAPHTTLPPDQINILRTAVNEAQASEQAAASSAEEANQSAQDAAASAAAAEESANEIKELQVETQTLEPEESATASYDATTGVLTLGIPQGEKGDTGEIPTEWKDELDSVAADVENLATVANTGSYDDLSDKPFIPTNVSDLIDDSGHYTKPATGIPASDLEETYLTQHQDISGKANIADLATVATTGSYNDLSNKPTIPTKVSDLTNDAGYISGYTETDPTVPAWAKAAQKPTYTASEVGATTEQQVSSMIADAIGDIHSFDMAVVQALPTTDISTHTIYLVPKTGETNDVYDEYIYVNNAWEMIGNTQVDLSNYVQKTDYATANTGGVVKVSGLNGIGINEPTGHIYVMGAQSNIIKSGNGTYFPIVPTHQHEATFYGLAKAAGDSTQASSENAVGTYTAAAKTAIQTMLDVPAKADVPTNISDLNNDSDFVREYYGVCNTAKGTAAKQVTIDNLTSFTTGTTIKVKFVAENTASNPKLEINGGEQVPIMRYGTTAASTAAASSWNAGAVVPLTYDGTNWIINNFNNTTYSAISEAAVTAGTDTSSRLITAARLKLGVETHAPVKSVNGQTGAVQLNAVEYGNFQNLTAAEQQMALANLGLSNEVLPISDDLYKSRAVSGGEKVKIDQIVGGTVAWHQLAHMPSSYPTPNEPIHLSSSAKNATFSGAGYNYTTYAHKYLVTITVSNAANGGSDKFGVQAVGISIPAFARSIENGSYATIVEGNPNGSVTKTTVYVYLSSSASATAAMDVTNVQLFDLTQMFGSAVAEYIYGLETATPGAGVALFRQMFPESYYPYNAGELVSVQTSGRKTVGYNLFDKAAATQGEYYLSNGTINRNSGRGHSDFIRVTPGVSYYTNASSISNVWLCLFFDSSKQYVNRVNLPTFTAPAGAVYMAINFPIEQLDSLVVNISDPSRNGQYEPYSAHTYPLDSTMTLRGIPVMSNGVPAYDGDKYAPDGTVTRRYGIVDLGTLTWSAIETAVTGVYRMRTNGLSSLIKPSTSTSAVGNLLCQKYPAFSWNKSYNADSGDGIAVASAHGAVCVNDSAYNTASSADAFTTAMSGVYLVYELATPTTETADPYTAIQDAGTTEEFLGTSVPVGVKDCYYCAQSIVDVKADKVQNATSGNFAALDVNGNLTDSGHKHSDYLTTHQDLSNYVKKTDLPNGFNPGVVRVATSAGISADTTYGILTLTPLTHDLVKGGNCIYAVSPTWQHESTFYGLAKAAGDDTQASSSNAVGTYTTEAKAAIRSMIGAAASADVTVQDVQVNGTSVVSSGIANVPIANDTTFGAVKIQEYFGVGQVNGLLFVNCANDGNVKAGTNTYRPIVPDNQHKAVFYGLAKAAGADMKDSANAVGTYTDAAKGAIQKMLGVTDLFGNEENDVTANRAYAIGEAFVSNGKLYRATAAIAQDGAIVTDGNGANCVEISVAGDFVKRTDIANSTTPGVMKVTTGGLGLVINADKVLQVSPADATTIKDGTQGYRPITPYHQHESVFYGLAKAAGTDMKSSSNAVGTYTDEAKTAIRAMLDAVGSSDYATSSAAGVVKVNSDYGIRLNENNVLRTSGAQENHIQGGVNTYLPITPYHQHEAVYFGLAKAAGVDLKNESLYPWSSPMNYPAAASAAIRSMIGAIGNTDYATDSVGGVVKVGDGSYGIKLNDSNMLRILGASQNDLKAGSNYYKPVIPVYQHTSVFYGLSKAAGVDLANETITLGTYPSTAKTAIRTMLGAVGTEDYATSSTAGVVKTSQSYGTTMTSGALTIAPASNDNIKGGTNAYKPIVPAKQDQAVFYGLAKAAGDTTQSSSSNAVGTYTAEAKGAIRTMLDIDDSIVEEYISSTSPTITAGPNCRYICGEVTSVSFTPCASGSCELMFTSGSSVAVLTLPSTVKMPEWFEVETNTIYDIIITNGVYGAVMSWPL